MIFVTCADAEPPTGFDPQPSVTYIEAVIPTSSTCSNILRLPLKHKRYEDFKAGMIEGIVGGQDFGHFEYTLRHNLQYLFESKIYTSK